MNLQGLSSMTPEAPTSPAAEASPAASAATSRDSDSTILIVDDTPINRRLLRGILKRGGHTLIEASNGLEALAAAESELPDLILLDIMMPELDGYEVCSRLKSRDDTCNIPIIILSALDRPADRVRGLELGAADYVTKPFDRAEVVARVNTQLQLQQANRELRARQAQVESELHAAADIQRSLLPSPQLAIPGVDVFWHFEPCDSLGGDMINVMPLTSEETALYLLDVSGHGVPSALVTVSVVQRLLPHGGLVLDPSDPRGTTAPAAVLAELDENYPMERFHKHLTIAYALLDHETGLLRYSCAAHPYPVLLRSDGCLELLEAGGSVIGMGGILPFDEEEVQLERGDRLFLYTDGIVELEAPDGEQYGEQQFYDFLDSHRHLSLEELTNTLNRDLEVHARGLPPNDDISLVALEWQGEGRGERQEGSK